MHSHHNVFTIGIENKKKIIITYYSGVQKLYLTGVLVPLRYFPSDWESDPDFYFFWDSEAVVGERMLALSSSQITYMELSEESFNPNDYVITETDES